MTAPTAGLTIAFNRISFNAEGTEAGLWLCAKAADPSIVSVLANETEPHSDRAGWVLEASDVVIAEGHQSFYLKNLATGKYIKFIDEGDDENTDCTLGEKEEAKSFIIVNTKVGAPILGSTETDFGDKGGPLKDTDWMLISKFGEDYNAINTVSGANSQAYMAEYADYAAWYTVYEVESYESTIADCQDALEEMPELLIKGGTNPGCYPEDLVAEYNAARLALYNMANQVDEPTNEEAQAAIERLRAADAAIKAATRVPLTTGYYRIISAYPEFEAQQEGQRYMMNGSNESLNWSAYNTTAENGVWYITKLAGNEVSIQNVENTLFICAPNSLGETSTDKVTITFFDDASSAAIRINNSAPLHSAQHNSGAGTGGNIVTWDGSAGSCSSWYLESVEESEASTFAAALAQNKITKEFNKVLAEVEEKYNIAAVYVKTGNGLINTVNQITSNADHNTLASEPDGAGIPGLIDNDIHTYFHSVWNAEVAPAAYHNLTIDLGQTIDKFAFSITARKYSKDGTSEEAELLNRPTEIVLYGAEDGADIDQPESWVKLRVLTGMPSSTTKVADEELTYTSAGYPLFSEYKYLRFEVTKTNNGKGVSVEGKSYPFFSMAEFQVYTAELDATCQMAGLGEVGTAFEEAYKKALGITTPTQQDVDELRAALQAFIEGGLADPTELKAALDEATALVDGIIEVEDENEIQPGKYKYGTKEELAAAVESAQAYYDTPTEYTPQGLKDETAKLRAAIETAKNAIYAFSTSTWYRIQHCTTFYVVNDVPELQPTERTGEIYSANSIDEGVENGALKFGTQDELEDVADDQFMWRLVPVGEDGKYALQNKATNMFMGGFRVGTGGSGNYAAASLNAALFTLEPVGYAAYAFIATELNGSSVDTNGQGRNILHAPTDHDNIVYWKTKGVPVLNADKTAIADNSGASWELIPVEEFEEADVEGLTFSTLLAKGELQTACYPFSTTMTGEDLAVYSISAINEDATALYLVELGREEVEIEAGKPVFYTVGGITPDEFVRPSAPTENDSTYVNIIVNTDFISSPLTENGLIGHFYNRNVNAGYGVTGIAESKNVITPLKSDGLIGANKAYINKYGITGTPAEDDIEIAIKGELNTAIQNAIADKLNGTVDVYTIDGIRVRQAVKYGKATEGLQKGLYIINKKVVAVD